MRPLILDLSQWRPLGLDLGALVAAHWWLFAAAAGAGLLLMLWAQGQVPRRGRAMHALTALGLLVLLAALATLGAGFGRVHSYGLMLALGFLTAIALARWRTRRCGENPDTITTLGILALVGGVVGARAAYVIEHWDDFAGRGLLDMAAVSSGGLVFDGGLVLSLLMVVGYLYGKRLPVRRFLDIVAVSAMVGLAFGRVGCLLNGCCFGGPSQPDFALAARFPYASPPLIYPHAGVSPFPRDTSPSPAYYQQFHRGELTQVPPELMSGTGLLKHPAELRTPEEVHAALHARSEALHPAQAYGIVNALLLAALLAAFFRLRSREGQVAALLLILYPITRFVLEAIRGDNPGMLLTPAQGKSLVLLAVGLAMMAYLRRLPASCGPTYLQRQAQAQPAPRGSGRTGDVAAAQTRRKARRRR